MTPVCHSPQTHGPFLYMPSRQGQTSCCPCAHILKLMSMPTQAYVAVTLMKMPSSSACCRDTHADANAHACCRDLPVTTHAHANLIMTTHADANPCAFCQDSHTDANSCACCRDFHVTTHADATSCDDIMRCQHIIQTLHSPFCHQAWQDGVNIKPPKL
jgi:hypothetical protein